MDKYLVEKNMANASAVITEVYGKTNPDKSVRSAMSAFGATVMMSGLEPAVAYYTKNNKAIVDMIEKMCEKNGTEMKSIDVEDILAYSVSLKLALNMFIVEKGE